MKKLTKFEVEQKDHKNYALAKTIKTVDKETINVVNPITGKQALVTISRTGTTDEKLALVMLSPDATRDQKDSFVSNYLFERGKDNASFLAELYISKGTHVKETQAFKRQIRWDFEMFANLLTTQFTELSNEIKETNIKHNDPMVTLVLLSNKLAGIAELLETQRSQITNARMKEKGFGIYLDRNGKAFSLEDNDIVDIIKGDKEVFDNDNKN